MIVRFGFNSNSSNTSYTCEVCGRKICGFDPPISEYEMSYCVNGHILCDSHVRTASPFFKSAATTYLALHVLTQREIELNNLIEQIWALQDQGLNTETISDHLINMRNVGSPDLAHKKQTESSSDDEISEHVFQIIANLRNKSIDKSVSEIDLELQAILAEKSRLLKMFANDLEWLKMTRDELLRTAVHLDYIPSEIYWSNENPQGYQELKASESEETSLYTLEDHYFGFYYRDRTIPRYTWGSRNDDVSAFDCPLCSGFEYYEPVPQYPYSAEECGEEEDDDDEDDDDY